MYIAYIPTLLLNISVSELLHSTLS